MIFRSVSLEPVAVRAQRLQVARAIVVMIAISVVHVQLTTPFGNKTAHLTKGLL